MDISLTKILLTHYELICFMISFCIIGVFELQWALSPTGTGIYLIRNVPAFPLLSPFLTSVSFHLIQTSLSIWQLKPLWAWGRYASIWWRTKQPIDQIDFKDLKERKNNSDVPEADFYSSTVGQWWQLWAVVAHKRQGYHALGTRKMNLASIIWNKDISRHGYTVIWW